MPYAALGSCMATLDEAAQHACAHAFPAVSPTRVVTCSGTDGSGGLQLVVDEIGVGTTASVVGFAAPSCDPFTFTSGPLPWGLSTADGLLVGGAIFTAWSLAWIWTAIRRSLGDHNEPES